MRARPFLLSLLIICLIGQACPAETRLTLRVVDSKTRAPLAARVYVTGSGGELFYLESDAPEGSALRYDRGPAAGSLFAEHHTTISAHPGHVDLPPGRYTIQVERGKEYFAAEESVDIGETPQELTIELRRWIDMAARGWYSGETHVHRMPDELRNVALAEDLNVTFPLSYWVIESGTPPTEKNRSPIRDVPAELIVLDETHVVWPRNTEYEIFSVGEKRHTLGALAILNHKTPFERGVPPWSPVIDEARRQGALFDIEKFAWQFSAVVPPLAPDALYELANNHLWRTGLFFRNWYTPAPPYMQPPFGGKGGTEREWIDFTFSMYYTLLDAGYRLAPTAGSANGVLAVPMGYSRVYVSQPDGFSYDNWLKGLRDGHSFVTTGPMLVAQANGQPAGATFSSLAEPVTVKLEAEIDSAHSIAFAEVVINGLPERTLRGAGEKTEAGATRYVLKDSFSVPRSGWFAVRCYEERPNGRVCFAHTAPWYVTIGNETVQPRREEKRYLVGRMTDEIARSQGVVPPEALAEYERVLHRYEELPIADDSQEVAEQGRTPKTPEELREWLRNMQQHRYTPVEMRLTTGLSVAEIEKELSSIAAQKGGEAEESSEFVLPYPGGRHCRIGFRDGAINPQRDTKLSVFTPWPDGGYVVVDLPEAVFSNLGLIYLAHTHVPTIWEKAGVTLPPLEWNRTAEGTFEFERLLPNGVRFGAVATPGEKTVGFELWLENGTPQPLTGMRAQVCVMLKGAAGFNARTNQNKIFDGPFVAVGNDDKDRWIITAWEPLQRAWANPPVPCLHSDPLLPDCAPGKRVHATGRLWFFEGKDIEQELARLRASNWNRPEK